MPRLTARAERWPLAEAFVIARGAKTEAEVVVAEISDGACRGRGEATPYARYGESVDSVLAQIASAGDALEAGAGRAELQDLLTAGAARNALDCALWDLDAKRAGVRAWTLAGRARLDPVKTCFTISLGTPKEMAAAAAIQARRPMLKLKIGGPDDLAGVAAVRAAAPRTRLIVDANESLGFDELRRLAPEFARLEVQLIEQPLPVGDDAALDGYVSPVPLCADESLHTRADLAACAGRYAYVNIKLDKAGGLTEALALAQAARTQGFGIMTGCMVATSLAIAPAMILAQGAGFVDLDGPLLLARDREPGLAITGSLLEPPSPELWG
ncbi:dipeptide epimerase [Phenylobacterium hankyongense]|uniref:Dipeptide epimerase n=1 Tax=Phenylobacterium hankyongense TaxID=1813876 RepID=A0A328B1M6_9CAUL|nr:N-acetyl-D-Glu racemase DgcA [Phenylobacterium hankyongense]RAK60717.1 dipeptide epimerase [Phenylobacterium hankyongense]